MADLNPKKNKKLVFNPYWIYGIVAVILVGISTVFTGSSPHSLPYSRFETELLGRQGVDKIVVIRNDLQAEVTPSPIRSRIIRTSSQARYLCPAKARISLWTCPALTVSRRAARPLSRPSTAPSLSTMSSAASSLVTS